MPLLAPGRRQRQPAHAHRHEVVMTRLYYPLSRLWPDHLRAGLGLVFCVALMLFNAPVSVIFFVLAGVSLLLAWLSVHTLWRQQTEFALDGDGVQQISRWGWAKPKRIAWGELRSVKLRYFSTRRDGSAGWMTVTIRGHGGKVRADSDLEGFEPLVLRALNEAMRQGLTLDAATEINARLLQQGLNRNGLL